MSGSPDPARQRPVAAMVLTLAAFVLYAFVLGNAIALPRLESIDKGIAAIYALVGIVLLWLVLAALLFLGAAKGKMPGWAAATAFVAHPASAAAAMTALVLLADRRDADSLYYLFLVLPPPLLVGYALWAHFPRLHSLLPATPTSTAVLGTLLVLSLGQLAYTFERDRERALQSANDAKEAEILQQKELEAARQANLAKFQRLTADSPLWDWQEFIGKGNELEKQAVAIVSKMPHRQADAELMLRNGEIFPLYHIGELDLEATPALCSGARDFFLRNASEGYPTSPEQRYLLVSDRFDAWLPTIRWLIGQHCDLGAVVVAMQDAVRRYPAEPERDKFLAALGRLDPQWGRCSGDANTSPDARIAGCTAAITGGSAVNENIAIAYFHRGDAYQAKDESGSAIRDYDEAVRLRPDFAEALNNRGNAHDDLGDHVQAIRDYDAAIRVKADFAQAFNNRGTSYDEMGEHGRAIQDFDQAIKLDPKYLNAMKNRGRSRFFMGDFAAAAVDFAQALAQQRTDAYAALWLHLARVHAGKASNEELRRDSESLDQAAWPWPVVAAYLGEQDRIAVQRVADHAGADAKDQQCDAAFYLGAHAISTGERTAGLDMLQQAAKTCAPNSIEYYAARFTIKQAPP